MTTRFPPDVVAAVCRHMDDDHAEAALLIARALGEVPDAVAARTTDLDGDGLVLTVTRRGGDEQVVRVPFAAPVTERAEVRAAVVELHERAR